MIRKNMIVGCNNAVLARRASSFYIHQQRRRFQSALVQIDPIVKEALEQKRPVVALESTIVAHGMPFPENLNLSKDLAAILRSQGVEPATIAVRNGVCRIGLSDDELEDLARAGSKALKCSTRELPLLLAAHKKKNNNKQNDAAQWGATTVASTMVLAQRAGISTFVTGGIGGVHRHAEITMDVSADLIELSRTPVVVVSAGIKSILDIAKTLEVLETYGVPVVSYQTDEFPAFFSPHSGIKASARMDNVDEIAHAFMAAKELGLSHGMLVAVPNHDPAGVTVEDAIQAALQEAEERKIHGSAVTPFILKRVAELTAGDSLKSNIALVKRNASIGAEIAIALANLRATTTTTTTSRSSVSHGRHLNGQARGVSTGGSNVVVNDNIVMPKYSKYKAEIAIALANLRSTGYRPVSTYGRQLTTPPPPPPPLGVVVMGGAAVDIIAKPKAGEKLILKTSNPASCQETDGGVARNVAEVLGRLGSRPDFFTAVGNDGRGEALLQRLTKQCRVDTFQKNAVVVDGAHTATYLAVLDGDRDLHVACADMDVFDYMSVLPESALQNAGYLVLDANPPLPVLRESAVLANKAGVKVLWEPTSVPKARRAAQDDQFMSCLTYATPNLDELWAMDQDVTPGFKLSESEITTSELDVVKDKARSVLSRMHPTTAHLVITLGSNGVVLASKHAPQQTLFRHYPATKKILVANATGAGDSLVGAFVHALSSKGATEEEAVLFGMQAAEQSLQCADQAVSPNVESLQFHR